MRIHRSVRAASRLLAMFAVLAGFAGAMHAQTPHVYVVRLGADTVAIDRIIRTSKGVEGDLIVRSPTTRRTHYVGELASDGTFTSFESYDVDAAGTPLTAVPRHTMTRAGDSVIVRTRRDTATSLRTVGAGRQVTPILTAFYNFGMFEHAIERAVAAGKDSVDLSMLSYPSASLPISSYLKRVGRDSVSIPWGPIIGGRGPMVAVLDGAGRVRRIDLGGTTVKVAADLQTRDLDIASITAEFLRRDAVSGPAGRFSTRDTVRGVVGQAAVTLDYGRPARRGRDIWGGVVVWGDVWRVGADAATQFTTTMDLTIAGQPVPAGRYTLWIVPERDAATLIISKLVGVWGTGYAATRDLVRLPMRVEQPGVMVEQLTAQFVPGAAGATSLQIEWAGRRLSVELASSRAGESPRPTSTSWRSKLRRG